MKQAAKKILKNKLTNSVLVCYNEGVYDMANRIRHTFSFLLWGGSLLLKEGTIKVPSFNYFNKYMDMVYQ